MGYNPGGASGWALIGNAGTVPGTNFLGTTDAVDLQIRANNTTRIEVDSDGYTTFGGTDVDFQAGRGIFEISTTIDDIPAGTNQINGALVNPIFEWTGLQSGFGGAATAMNFTAVSRPDSGLGAASDAFFVRGLLANANYSDNGTGRTLANITGAQLQANTSGSGTITNASGMICQAGTALGGTVTQAVGVDCTYFRFLGGTVTTGIALLARGNASATNNWCAQFRGTAPSYIEGATSFGHTGVPNYIMDGTFARIRSSGYLRFGGTTAAASTQITAGANDGIFTLSSVVGSGNNENLQIDLESVAGVVEMTTSTADEVHFNFGQVAFGSDNFGGGNGIFKFTAPARAPNLNGGYADMNFTAAANIDLTGFAMSEVVTMSLPTPSITLGGGTVTNTAALLLGGNAGTAGTNNYILWQQGTVGINLFNAETQFTGDLAHSGTNFGIFSATPTTQPADPVALTDSTGGTANNTVAAVSGSGDDATINDNFADLTAKYNALRTGLRSLGIFA